MCKDEQNPVLLRFALAASIVAGAMASPMSSAVSAQAGADAPDVRNVPPVVMLLVDTSGSMERLPQCVCTTPGCLECQPQCGPTVTDERNRWATVVEALTGQWESFECTRQVRTGGSFVGAFDQGYAIPHFAPPVGDPQLNNGILDVYVDRVKFGLMTFDGISTFTDLSTDLLPARLFNNRLTDNVTAPGGFSYGGPQEYTFPGCGEPHMLDNGARNENADIGALVSVGSDLADERAAINQRIQDVLMNARPYGGTPIAGMLEDARHYFNNHPDVKPVTIAGGAGDPFASCRNRYVVLLTDGEPGADMRGDPVNCDAEGFECPYELPENIAAELCQYSGSDGACTGLVEGVFVVGFDIADETVQEQLDLIADLGGTARFAEEFGCEGADASSGCTGDAGALKASNLQSLTSALAAAIDAAQPGTTTRSVPAFATAALGADVQTQSQLNAGFRIGEQAGAPWEGVLERRRFECNESLEPEPQPVTSADKFHEVLNDRTAGRRLLTVVPRDPANLGGHLVGEDTGLATVGGGGNSRRGGNNPGPGGAPTTCDDQPGGGGGGGGGGGNAGGGGNPNDTGPAESGLTLSDFDTSNPGLGPEVFGVDTQAEADALVRWVHGGSGTPREDVRLGDIYHSSPVVVSAPQQDAPDESFNQFRQLPEVANRPTVLYVGSNDGVLHAFAVEDTQITAGPHAGTTLRAGEELWGFVPPLLLPKLSSASTSHQWMVDGTPVVREVFFARAPGANPSGDIYHTVLVVGMRGGGNGYIALDVTDPFEPEFLFQFAHPDMGMTYGQAGLGQILADTSAGLQERGFVFLPGGKGNDLTTELCGGAVVEEDGRLSKPIGCPARGKGRPPANQGTDVARENQRCWDSTGRHLFFVDLGTGELISQLDDRVFNAPLSGGVSLYPGQVGQVATRAFITDGDGMLWRIDISDPNMANWDATPFFDMFFDADAVDGQPGYFPPVVTTNENEEVVVLQGTGNLDRLDGLAANRVVSVTEKIEFASNGSVSSVEADLNWIIRLEQGEQVTGPLELFSGNVFFSTFRSSTSTTDACRFGDGFIWGAHFQNNPEDAPDSSTAPQPILDLDADDPDNAEVLKTPDGTFENQLILGVTVDQAPTCVALTQPSETDPFLGPRQRASATGGGGFQLVGLTSQGSDRAPGAEISEVRMDLPQPQSFTRPQAFAGTIDR